MKLTAISIATLLLTLIAGTAIADPEPESGGTVLDVVKDTVIGPGDKCVGVNEHIGGWDYTCSGAYFQNGELRCVGSYNRASDGQEYCA